MTENEYQMVLKITRCLVQTNQLLLSALDILDEAKVLKSDTRESLAKRHELTAKVLEEAQILIETHGQFGLGKKQYEN